jgi:hypothetical protein
VLYGFGAIGDLPVGASSIGSGFPLFWDETEPPVVVVSHRKRKKFYTRDEDNLNIYWQSDDAALKVDDSKPANKQARLAKPLKQAVEAKQAAPDEVVPLSSIEALARQYDELQAYYRAVEMNQYAQLARLYERLQDEADVEFLLMHA